MEKDISDEDSVKEIYSETMQRFGRVDILVNNAATDDETGNDTIETITREVIDNTFAVNVRGSLMMTREFVSHNKGDGRVINLQPILRRILPDRLTMARARPRWKP